ncbi:ureidoglycolate lyase [Nitratireductor sp. ZSWI3]|uniref:ureidoglycolate lyase n=1 Tax=Nitratireductor sp. ZSWI3 TaxID=2966359 RepID=UPI00214FF7BF|nr:ureidoglycolate lyase [Nitratireductor sp. ZSWI3]MCR4266170.1 ureidoglycolate lyase [Nitratireductor sp. ZSWI3]
MTSIAAQRLTRQAFAPFGDVIETEGAESFLINGGKCRRFHDLARVEAAGDNARVLINLFRGQPYDFPLRLAMVERHPLGSQAFMPLTPNPFLVVVCPDEDGKPGMPQAFVTGPGQGVNYARGTWHGVLTPIGGEQEFLVVDRGGDGGNLEEYFFPEPHLITLPDPL